MKTRSLNSLRREAAKATHFRGHLMRWSLHHSESTSVYIGVCRRCEMQVTVNPRPLLNGIDIGGEAVALTCPGYKESDFPINLNPSDAEKQDVKDRLLKQGKYTTALGCAADRSCEAPIRYIDRKGWVYCTHHGLNRRMNQPCRPLTPAELGRLQRGELIRY